MKVVGFAGFSGAGKTTLIEQLIPLLRVQGLRVSVLKHAHHRFDIDQPGKDSWRHRQAGAFEVLLASDQRLALLRELPAPQEPDIHQLLAQFDASVDWVLVEGFKEAPIPKIEVWRAPEPGQSPHPLRYPQDADVIAIAIASNAALPAPTALAQLDLNAPAQLAAWLLAQGARLDYRAPAAAPSTEA